MSNKTNSDQCIVKDNKPKRLALKKKLVAGLLALGLAFGLGSTLTACNKPVQPEFTVANVTELVQKYENQTKAFLNNEVLEKAISDTLSNYDQSKVLGSTFDLGDGNSKLLDSVGLVFTYIEEGNNRSFGISNVDFNKNIELTKVAKYSENKTELSSAVDNSKVTTQTVTYDALEQSQNDALAEALFKNVVKSDETATQLVLKNNGIVDVAVEGGMTLYACNKYELTAHTANGVTNYNMYVKAQNNVQDMIASLSNSKNYKLDKTTNLETFGTTVVGKKYEKENIEKPPVIESIETVEELLQTNLTQAQNFLNAQTSEIAKQLKVQDSQNTNFIRYDFGDNNLTELNSVGFEMIISDPSVEGKETYYKGTANFGSPVDLNEIAKGTAKAKIANVETPTTFQFSAKEMFYKQGIVDALKEVAGITADTPVMVNFEADNAGKTTFTMKVITEKGLHDYELTVQTGANMAETIENIKTAGTMDKENGSKLTNGYTEKEYVAQEYKVESIEEALKFGSEQINLNLEPVYDFVYNNFLGKTADINSYKIDIGNVVDGKITNLKFAFSYKNTETNSDNYRIYNVELPTELTVNDLLNKSAIKNLSLSRQDVSREYNYSYNQASQGNKDDFIKAVVGQFDPDFITEDAQLLYTDNGTKLYPKYGEGRFFTIVMITDTGVRQYNIVTPDIDNSQLVDHIKKGDFELLNNGETAINFSDNQINVEIAKDAEQTNYEEYSL